MASFGKIWGCSVFKVKVEHQNDFSFSNSVFLRGHQKMRKKWPHWAIKRFNDCVTSRHNKIHILSSFSCWQDILLAISNVLKVWKVIYPTFNGQHSKFRRAVNSDQLRRSIRSKAREGTRHTCIVAKKRYYVKFYNYQIPNDKCLNDICLNK
jgi:hypothetical protein